MLAPVTNVLRDIWSTATTAAPRPGLVPVLVVAGVVPVLAQAPLLRQAVTVVHEAGHAVCAVGVGRRVSGIPRRSSVSPARTSTAPWIRCSTQASSPRPGQVGIACGGRTRCLRPSTRSRRGRGGAAAPETPYVLSAVAKEPQGRRARSAEELGVTP